MVYIAADFVSDMAELLSVRDALDGCVADWQTAHTSQVIGNLQVCSRERIEEERNEEEQI